MAADFVERVGNVFWADSFWLPNNLTWKDVISKRESGEMYLPLPRDLWAAFPIAVTLFTVRLLWERFVFFVVTKLTYPVTVLSVKL